MGDFTEHIFFGLFAGALILLFAEDFLTLAPDIATTSVMAVVIGSVLPDIDHKNSYVHRAVRAFLSLSAGALTAFLLPLQLHQRLGLGVIAFVLVFSIFYFKKIRHRGFTHSISFAVMLSSVTVISTVILLASAVPGIALGIGLLSHLVLDKEWKLE